jgi:aminoglycoside phosphotransferase (APT) family kinase protein
MSKALDRYLVALKRQVATALRPRDMGEVAGKNSLYVERVLNYLAVESRDLPDLTKTAVDACRSMLPDLATALHHDAPLVQDLRTHLADGSNAAQARVALQKAIAHLQEKPASADLVQRIGRIELELQNGFADAVTRESAPVVVPADANEGLSEQQKANLTTLLRKKYPQDKTLAIGRIKAIPGGFSKQTIFLELLNTKSLPTDVVLRIDKPDSPVETTVVNEFEIIQAMYAAGVPVPEPLLLESEKSVLGSAFVLVGRIDGAVAGDAFEVTDPCRSFGVTLAQGLAKMHTVSIAAVSKNVPGSKISVDQRMLGDIDHYEQKWRDSRQPSLTLEIAYGWLRANIASASSGHRAIVHRDVGCHNLLVKSGRLTAILDWETALIGDPAQDIGYTFHIVTQAMPWEEFLDEYERAGGNRPAPNQIVFYRVWRFVWLMTMQNQAKAAIEAGYTDDIGLIYNVLNLYQRLTVSLQSLLCEAGAAP